jgi:hypothetical protein
MYKDKTTVVTHRIATITSAGSFSINETNLYDALPFKRFMVRTTFSGGPINMESFNLTATLLRGEYSFDEKNTTISKLATGKGNSVIFEFDQEPCLACSSINISGTIVAPEGTTVIIMDLIVLTCLEIDGNIV